MDLDQDKIKELMDKYNSKISAENKTDDDAPDSKTSNTLINTKEYTEFKKQFLPPELTRYEQIAKKSEQILKIQATGEEKTKLEHAIEVAHLNITSTQAISFAYVVPIIFIVFGIFLAYLIPLVLTGVPSMFFPLVVLIIGVFLLTVLKNMPYRMAEQMIMKAGNSMIQAIFYVVTYMRSTSNLELAINFAADHLPAPLSLDFKKVIWDVENNKYNTVKDSLDNYLMRWREKAPEFVESLHLVESSLAEGTEARRLVILDKALELMMDGNYEKMMRYARDLKNPIAMLHMAGVVLPVLALVIMPMVVSFMDTVKWYHIATLYNVLLPGGVSYLAKSILSKRPAGSGGSQDIAVPATLNSTRVIQKFGMSLTPKVFSILIGAFFILIGLSPLIMHAVGMPDVIFSEDMQLSLLEYRITDAGNEIGPYGIGASLLSVFFVIGIGLMIGLNKKLSSSEQYKLMLQIQELENEFSSTMFQLANRLGDGMPLETAFENIAVSTRGSVSGKFYNQVNDNIQRLGMSIEQSLYDPEHGALNQYPSPMIHSSMKILVESIKKGPIIASEALNHISDYSSRIHQVNERLQDLMAEVISSIRSQMNMMAPLISSIVVGITTMITTIIGRIKAQMTEFSDVGGNMGLISTFSDGVPSYYFQIVVGIYVVSLILILAKLVVQVESGSNRTMENYQQGVSVIKGTLLYSVLSFGVSLGFNLLAASIISNTIR